MLLQTFLRKGFNLSSAAKVTNSARRGLFVGSANVRLCDVKHVKDETIKTPESTKTGEEKKKWYSRWTGKNMWKLGALSLGLSFVTSAGVIITEWGVPVKDEEGNIIPDEFSSLPTWQQYPRRAWREVMNYKQMILDPTSDKLLPDPLQEPYFQPPYTLVIELMGVLVHPDWSYKTGWRFRKRNGLDYLLKSCAYPMFEIVIFTHEPALTAHPLIDGLDTGNNVMFRLYRDSTRYKNGVHIKDLSCLNRDLSKVIFIDWDVNSGQLQPRNMLRLNKWKGEENDAGLVDLASFLRTLAMSGVDDVRPILEHYAQYDDPLFVFRENQRKLAEAEKAEATQTSPSLVGSASGTSGWRPWRR